MTRVKGGTISRARHKKALKQAKVLSGGEKVRLQLAKILKRNPNFLILGLLAAITTIIPYFGAFIVDVLALLIASVISTKLFVLTLIVVLICPQIDGYIIGPKIYGKTNII